LLPLFIGVNIDSTVKTVGAIEESVKSTADATSWNFRNNLKLA